MFPLIGLAATLVPDLIRLIAGDKAGALAQSVSQAVSDVAGTDDPVAAQKTIQADETLSAALQQRLTEIAIDATRVQAAASAEQRRAELAEIKASDENSADARSTMQALASAKSPIAWGSPLVSIVVTVGFFVILGLILFHGIAAVAGQTPDPTAVNIVNIAVGVLGTAFATVVNFWLGDSSGSRNKDAQAIDQQHTHARQIGDMLTALRQAHDTQAQSTQSAVTAMRDLASRVASPLPDRTAAAPKAQSAEPPPAQAVDDFPRCVAVTLAQEGGYVDDPQDPGGATNMGITLETLRHWRDDDSLGPDAVRALTRTDACEIYRADYWHPAACGRLRQPSSWGRSHGIRLRCQQRTPDLRQDTATHRWCYGRWIGWTHHPRRRACHGRKDPHRSVGGGPSGLSPWSGHLPHLWGRLDTPGRHGHGCCTGHDLKRAGAGRFVQPHRSGITVCRLSRHDRIIERQLRASRSLARRYRGSLQARLSQLKQCYPADQTPAVLEQAREALDRAGAKRTWETDFQVEQMLVGAYDTGAIDVEIQRALALGKGLLSRDLQHWYAGFDWRGRDLSTRRALLSRLIEDLQWALSQREMIRICRADLAARMSRRFILVSLLFGLFLVGVLTLHSHLVSAEWMQDIALRHMVSVAASFIGGLWGALFSMMTGIRNRIDGSNLDELKLQYRWLPARMLAGAGSGLLVYLLFASAMIGGDLFPDFRSDAASQQPGFSAGLELYGKLLLWSVVAGFSERLIPDVLARIESDVHSNQTVGSSRRRHNPRVDPEHPAGEPLESPFSPHRGHGADDDRSAID
nr:glycosyl hydrolase 108 family protein [uncultured Thiodictyon sp.]